MALLFVLPFGVTIFSLSFGLLFYVYRKFYCHQFFKRIGINGPEPHWLFGSTRELANGKRIAMMERWKDQYGDFFGYYEGSTPVLVVSSLEAVEQIMVKQFWNFQGHNMGPIQPDPRTDSKTSVFAVDLFFSWGAEWKRLRSNVSPGFSAAKLKSYMPLLNKSFAQLLTVLEKKALSGNAVNVHDVFQRLTLEIITTVALGAETGSLNVEHPNSNSVLQVVQGALSIVTEKPKILDMITYLSEVAGPLKRLMKWFVRVSAGGVMKPYSDFMTMCRQIVEKRTALASAIKHHDIIQTLIDNSTLGLKGRRQSADDGEEKCLSDVEPLTVNQVVSSTISLFVGGTDTPAAAISFACYLLATNQDAQDKLYQELLTVCKTKEDADQLDYATFMDLPYLDWVLKETLRLYPVGAFALNRFVVDDTVVCGVPISKKMGSVLINVPAINRDPHLWGPIDPARFYPERFSPENSSGRPGCAYLGFGYGPRICVGLRLALVEVKLTLLKMLIRFRIDVPDEGYPSEGIPLKTDALVLPRDGILVKLVQRKLVS